MKYSQKKLINFLLFIMMSGCSSLSLFRAESDFPALLQKTTSELEKLEFQKPNDPSIKEALAIRYYCEKRPAVAYQHWLWLIEFSPQEERQFEWNRNIEKYRKKDFTIYYDLNCDAIILK